MNHDRTELLEFVKEASEAEQDISRLSDVEKYSLLLSKKDKLPSDTVDKIVLSLQGTQQLNALKFLSDLDGVTVLKVFDCIIRGKDRDSLEPGQLFEPKIVEAVLRGYQQWKQSDRIKIYFSNAAKEKWIHMSDLLVKIQEYSEKHRKSIILAPIKFAIEESCGTNPQWHLLLFTVEEPSLYHLHFIEESFSWPESLTEEIKPHSSYKKIKSSWESGLYVIQWAQCLMDNPDISAISDIQNSGLRLTNKAIISFLRLEKFYCRNKFCNEYFDTKAERDIHRGKCQFTVDENGRTVLFACSSKQLKVFRTLLHSIPRSERETYVMTKDHHGKTALHDCENKVIAELLINAVGEQQRDNFIMVKDHDGRTALHECKNKKMAEYLISSVSKEQRDNLILIKDNQGKTAHEGKNKALTNFLIHSLSEEQRKNLLASGSTFTEPHHGTEPLEQDEHKTQEVLYQYKELINIEVSDTKKRATAPCATVDWIPREQNYAKVTKNRLSEEQKDKLMLPSDYIGKTAPDYCLQEKVDLPPIYSQLPEDPSNEEAELFEAPIVRDGSTKGMTETAIVKPGTTSDIYSDLEKQLVPQISSFDLLNSTIPSSQEKTKNSYKNRLSKSIGLNSIQLCRVGCNNIVTNHFRDSSLNKFECVV